MKLPRQEMKRARIEIIPMIDTIFFLLVFFMIASLAMIPMSAHKVDLPSSSTAALKPLEKAVVTISKEGDYYIDQKKIAGVGDIKPMVASRLAQNPSLVVVINCDKSQQISKFTQALDLVKQANAQNVMVATDPQSPLEAAH
ncbi:MAG: biopolymer transporter ExbD [Capsulimonas sp.]|uniref:ExbD/TolR family protein n=1 Tax=Capsulimonas sp. TaxID=2494211 RepID=UPI0032656836|nr:Biopolymer transport protein ExbD/TolR [Capsulimonas sp.]